MAMTASFVDFGAASRFGATSRLGGRTDTFVAVESRPAIGCFSEQPLPIATKSSKQNSSGTACLRVNDRSLHMRQELSISGDGPIHRIPLKSIHLVSRVHRRSPPHNGIQTWAWVLHVAVVDFPAMTQAA